jgi:DNA replication protein DnaC
MLRLASILPHTAPSFATRVRWAVDEADSESLAALQAENPAEFEALAAQRQTSPIKDPRTESNAQLSLGLTLARQRREAYLVQSKAPITDTVRSAIIAGSLMRTEAVRTATSWLKTRSTPWLILSGKPDTGKSVAAAAALAAHSGRWFSANEIAHAFSGSFGEAFLAQQHAKECKLLVIDELGGEDVAARMVSALLQLLNARNSTERTPVIATTNLTFEALIERYANDRIRSRFNELATWAALSPGKLRPTRPQLFCAKEAV